MEGLEVFGVLLGLGFSAYLLLGPLVAMIRSGRAKRLAQENQDATRKLTERVHSLEAQVQEMQGRLKAQALQLEVALSDQRPRPAAPLAPEPAMAPAAAAPAPTPVVAAGTATPPAAPPRPLVVVAPAAPALRTPTPAQPPTQPPAPSIMEAPIAAGTAPPAAPSVTETASAPAPAAAPQAAIAPPQFAVLEKPKRSPQETAKRAWNIEEVLGTDWLNKLGVISVVMGVAFFLAHEMQVWGPWGKVLMGFAVGGALLGAGIFFERRERWRTMARGAMGGGWALFYLTTYAMNHFQPARVLTSEAWDFVLLLLVAAAMVAHTLRYNSRVVTGLAFLLAFSTINISHAGVYSLLASAILALALVIIVKQRRWFDLEVIAIAALYVNHLIWLRPIIEPMGEHHHAFPELLPSTFLLLLYWLIFRFSYIVRRIDEPQEENISTAAAILNTFFFHSLIKYQSVHPELAFWFLLGVGTVEMVLGQLPITRRRRTAFVILTTLGAILLVAAFPYRYSGGRLSIIWLAEAEALLLAGVFSREILFRWLGIATEVLVAGHLFLFDTRRLFELREAKAVDFSDPRRTVLFGCAALLLFANAHWIPRRWPGIWGESETKLYRLQSYLGGFLLLAAVWAACPEPWLAVGFAACALLLAVLGARWKIEEFSVLANSFAVLGFLRVIFANFDLIEVGYFNARGVISILLAAALLYAAARWVGFPAPVKTFRIPEVYTWVATFVVALLAWYQLWPASVALGWALIGLVAFQLGCRRQSLSWRLQGYGLFLSSFLRILFVNFNAEGTPGQLSPRLYTALPLAVLFYFVYEQLENRSEPDFRWDSRLKVAEVHCYLGTLTLAAALRFELSLDWIAAAWAALVLIFVVLCWRTGRRTFLHQALLLAAAVFFRTLFHNFYQRSYFPAPSFWTGRWATVGATLVLMTFALLAARRLKQARAEVAAAGRLKRLLASLHRNPAQAFFFVAFILLTGLLYVQLHAHGMTTVAWGAESVAVFLFALAVKERSYRLSALALLLICVAKIVVMDVWGLSPRDRYLTFMAMGVALSSVSFLYTRYKEVLRAYL